MPFFPWRQNLDFSILDLLLRRCSNPQQCKQLHSRIILLGKFHHSSVLSARVIAVYGRLGLLNEAHQVFHGDPKESLLWNSILRSNLSHGRHDSALALYRRMRDLGFAPDGLTLPLIIRSCSAAGSSKLCKAVHTHVVVWGFSHHLHVTNELILMYGSNGELSLAQNLFDRMPSRNIIAWNSLLAGFAAAHDGDGALKLFRGMELEGPEPSPVSWTSLISAHAREGKHAFVFGLFQEMVSRRSRPTPETLAVVLSVSTEMRLLHEGKALHLIVVRDGLELYVFVRNSLISLYGMLGDTEKEAELIFSETKPKNLVTWNCIISCHAARLRHEKSLQLFMEMQETAGLKPNTVTWSAVIGGLASGGRFSQALEMFRRMQELSVRHNSVTLVTVISSCAELSALWLGKEVHGHTLRTSFAANSGPNLVENGLISMYAKCGSLKDARRVFDGLSTRRDIVSWNAMISSYGISGLGGEALALFKEMVVAGIEPDGISYVAVLSACAHAGLVAEGKQLFRRVKRPGVEHYACLVDLLGRAGLLDEARSMIEQMVMEPNVYVWGALLNACRMHGNEVMAEEVGNRMLSLGAEIAGSCSLLANVYAACGRWDDSGQVRMMMRNKELRKSPGQSWIEVGKAVYVFTSGAPLKPEMEVVYQVLDELSQLMERWE